jgi:hypothetical protein
VDIYLIKISPQALNEPPAREKELEFELGQVRIAINALQGLIGKSPERGTTMLETIVQIVNQSKKPVEREELKARLEKAGFTGKSLGNYLYTAIGRLKTQKKVKVLKGGVLAKV